MVVHLAVSAEWMHNPLRVQPLGARGQEEMVRIAVLVSDPDLSEAVAAALVALGSVEVPAGDPATLEDKDWNVCVTEAGSGDMAVEPRAGRALVVLTEGPEPPNVARPEGGAGAIVLLRLPFTLADLRRSVRTAAAAARASEGPAAAP